MLFRKKDPQEKSQKQTRHAIILIIVFLVASVGVTLWKYHWPSEDIYLADQHLEVLVAKTPWHWQRGLGKRDSIAPYDGMLFLFGIHGKHGIVMRDMRFDIDIVWLDRGEVVDIAPHVPVEHVPEEQLTAYIPRKPANMVLELPAGWVFEHELKIGDRMTVAQ